MWHWIPPPSIRSIVQEDWFNRVDTMDVVEARQIVSDAGKKLIAYGLVGGTWGNISCRISDTRMAITPSGMIYETLCPEDITIVDFSSNYAT